MNILQILLDDIGLEQLSAFGRGTDYPSTPTIDSWCTGGVTFSKFYVQQLCSPTRATLLCGQHPYAHGIGDLVRGPFTSPASTLRQGLGKPTVAQWIRKLRPGLLTAAFGKYHLATEWEGGNRAPQLQGFHHFSGNMFNLRSPAESYYSWEKNTNGRVLTEDEYLPAVNIRECASWIRQRGREPWFVHLAPFSCHTPLQVTGIPPSGTYDPTWNTATELGVFKACIESIDYYLAELEASIPPSVWNDTLVFLMTDNGSGQTIVAAETDPVTGTAYPQTVSDPYSLRDSDGLAWIGSRGKDSPFDTGVHVPLVVYSPGSHVTAPGRNVSQIVQVADICPTVLDMLGLSPPVGAFHGKSLRGFIDNTSSAALHDFVYSEHFLQNHGVNQTTGEQFHPVLDRYRSENQWMAYDGRYVLLYQEPLNYSGSWHFYDLDNDPHQLTNLTPGGDTSALTTAQAAARRALYLGREALVAAG